MQLATRARGLGIGVIAAVALATSSAAAPAPAAASSPADRVIAIATAQVGDRYVFGAIGPNSFDCSGLVIYAFREAGYFSRIGDGRYRTTWQMWDWFRSRGLASTTGGQRGDLVLYGDGGHIGIYLGNGQVISAITSGVRIHGINALSMKFRTFLHTGLNAGTTSSSVTSAPASREFNVADHVRSTTTALNMRTGPSTAYRSVGVLPSGSRVWATKAARDASGQTWYWAWSYEARKSVWVAGWYTRAR